MTFKQMSNVCPWNNKDGTCKVGKPCTAEDCAVWFFMKPETCNHDYVTQLTFSGSKVVCRHCGMVKV